MKYNCNDEEVMERCGTERNMKDNCETEPGEEIEVECGSIDDAVCVINEIIGTSNFRYTHKIVLLSA